MIRNLIMLLVICLFATLAHAAQISIDPSYMDVSTGENFTVDIVIDPEGGEVYGASYWLYYNNTVLNATLLTPGGFLKQDGWEDTFISKEINNTIGRIKYREMRLGPDNGVFNSGIFNTISFQVIINENEITELQFDPEWVGLSDPDANSIPTDTNNGSVSVKDYTCGDVDGIPGIKTNDGWLIFKNATNPGDPRYLLTSTKAADCDGIPGIKTNDGWLVFKNATNPGDPRYIISC